MSREDMTSFFGDAVHNSNLPSSGSSLTDIAEAASQLAA